MFMVASIGHLALTVKDMDKSLDFYCRGLGFERVFDLKHFQTGEPWIVYVHTGKGQFIELFYGGETGYEWSAVQCGFNHLCLVVDDIQEAKRQIEEAGYALEKQPKIGGDGNWQCWIRDPDGVRIEIMQLDPNSPQKQVKIQ
jgi:lactoylglutathione lyase